MKAFRVIPGLFYLTVLFVCVSSTLSAQVDYLTITGLVKDSKTENKIAYATITVLGTGIGTVTNADGEFILKVSKSLESEYFEISHISYVTLKFRIGDAVGAHNTFFLEMQPVQLKEIPVIPRDARSIVESAFKKIPENYSQVPNMMTGFYREFIMQRRDYISISEAVVDIYKAPYHGLQNDQVKIYKGRKASDVKEADTLMVNLQGGPKVLMLVDIVKHPGLSIGLDNPDRYEFEFGNVVAIDDELNWVIDFSPKPGNEEPLYFGKLYISQESRAITRAEFSLDLQDTEKASEMFVQKKPAGLIFNPVSTGYLVNYKKQDGVYYLSYMRVDLKFKCDWKKKVFRNNYTVMSELAVTDRTEDHIVKFENEEIFKSNMVLADKVEDFSDSDFWGEHNIIEPEESIESAIKKLARKLTDK